MYAANDANPWLRDARAARRRLPPLAAVLAASVFATAVLLSFKALDRPAAAWIEARLRGMAAPWPDTLAQGALQVLVFGSFLAAAFGATRIEGRSLWRLGPGWAGALAAGLAIGLAGFCASIAVAWLAGAVTAGPGTPAAPLLAGLLIGAGLVALQAMAEEAYFRGWLQPVLCARWGTWPGLLAAACLFAALHVLTGARGCLAIFNLFLGGVMFGLLALRSGGLMAPAAAHFAWNWTESGVLGLEPAPTGSLVGLHLRGGLLWSGGPDTMNGSLATTLILVVLTTGLVLTRSRRAAGDGSDPGAEAAVSAPAARRLAASRRRS